MAEYRSYGEVVMKNKDKIVVAFLVSMGFFTAKYAGDYVKSLSDGQKASIFTLAMENRGYLTVCEGSPVSGVTHTSETKSNG